MYYFLPLRDNFKPFPIQPFSKQLNELPSAKRPLNLQVQSSSWHLFSMLAENKRYIIRKYIPAQNYLLKIYKTNVENPELTKNI